MKTLFCNYPFLIYLIICFCNIQGSLQAQIEIIPNVSTYKSIEDLYKFELEYNHSVPIKVTCQITLISDAGTVYETSSIPVLILNGIQSFEISKLSPLQIKQNKLFKQNELKNINYAIIQINNERGEILYKYVKDITDVNRGDPHSNSDKNHTFQFNGQSEVESVLSDRTAFLSMQPRNYVRAMIRPTLSVFDVPFGLNVLLTTESNASKQNLNKVTFIFDAQEFKSRLNKRISNSVKEFQNKTSSSLTDKFINYENEQIDQKFPKYKSQMAQQADSGKAMLKYKLERAEHLDAIFEAKSIDQNKERLTALLKRKSALNEGESLELKQLEAFQTEVNKLETERQQLKQITNKYKQEQNKFKNLEKEVRSFKSNLYKVRPQNISSLKNFGLIKKWETLLLGLQKFNLGRNYPFFSKYSLNGPSVNGMQLEFNPGLFYMHLVGGKSLQERIDSTYNLPQLSLAQNILGITLGLGSKQTSHFHISLIDIKDLAPSRNIKLSYQIRKNRILASEAQLNLLKNNLQLSIDWSSSFLDPDHNITQAISTSSQTKKPAFRFFYSDIDDGSGVMDQAYKLNCKYQLNKTGLRLEGLYEYIGQNYQSLGAPFLQQDLKRWKLELLQTLAGNKIRLKLFLRKDDNSRDPLTSSYSTQNTYYGMQVSAATSFGLSLEASFAPYAQSTTSNSVNPNQEFKQKMLQFQLAYRLNISQVVQSQSMFQFIGHFQEDNNNISSYNYKMFTLSESIQFKKINASIVSSYLPEAAFQATTNPQTFTIDASSTIPISSKIFGQFGLQYISARNRDDKFGLFCSSQIQIIKSLSLEFSYRKYNYN